MRPLATRESTIVENQPQEQYVACSHQEFMDDEGFKRWMTDTVLTYQGPKAGTQGPLGKPKYKSETGRCALALHLWFECPSKLTAGDVHSTVEHTKNVNFFA